MRSSRAYLWALQNKLCDSDVQDSRPTLHAAGSLQHASCPRPPFCVVRCAGLAGLRAHRAEGRADLAERQLVTATPNTRRTRRRCRVASTAMATPRPCPPPRSVPAIAASHPRIGSPEHENTRTRRRTTHDARTIALPPPLSRAAAVPYSPPDPSLPPSPCALPCLARHPCFTSLGILPPWAPT